MVGKNQGEPTEGKIGMGQFGGSAYIPSSLSSSDMIKKQHERL